MAQKKRDITRYNIQTEGELTEWIKKQAANLTVKEGVFIRMWMKATFEGIKARGETEQKAV